MRPDELSDRFETTDGSRPESTPLADAVAQRLPLAAFALLKEGDVFEAVGARPPPEGPRRARAYVEAQVRFETHGAPAEQVEAVRREMCRLLEGNPVLVERLGQARPLRVDLVPCGHPLAKYGYPRATSSRAVGLFWDHPSWEFARIALRQDALETERVLAIHEMAHAVHGLAFSKAEREEIYRVMLRTYRSRAAVDEVFAIYSERELLPEFSERERRTTGVYGMARSRWSEEHVFTRFVRHLYFPHKPLAGGSPWRGG